jgi:hypothetical protein
MSNTNRPPVLTISKGTYHDDAGFFIRENGRGGFGASVFVHTLPAARLYAIAILEGDDGLKRRVFATDGRPNFTMGDFDALIANAEQQRLIRYRGVEV